MGTSDLDLFRSKACGSVPGLTSQQSTAQIETMEEWKVEVEISPCFPAALYAVCVFVMFVDPLPCKDMSPWCEHHRGNSYDEYTYNHTLFHDPE